MTEQRPHYQQFSQKLIEHIAVNIHRPGQHILDPMAGIGVRIRQLENDYILVDGHRVRCGHVVHTLELELPWVDGYPHPRHHRHNSLTPLPFPEAYFDYIITSPTFGNRDADRSHGWASQEGRRTYEAALDAPVSEDSLVLQWGGGYRGMHERLWSNVLPHLRTGGYVMLNIKDHPRDGLRQDVSGFHLHALIARGGIVRHIGGVPTQGRPSGANTTATTLCGLVDPLIIVHFPQAWKLQTQSMKPHPHRWH